jgi:hypothetical protein
VNEGAFPAPFDSCFYAGESSYQLPSGGGQSSQSVTGVLKRLLDRFRLGDELRVERRRHDVSTFFGFLKGQDDFPVTHRILLHQRKGIRLWTPASIATLASWATNLVADDGDRGEIHGLVGANGPRHLAPVE